jgi:hypothetical protein
MEFQLIIAHCSDGIAIVVVRLRMEGSNGIAIAFNGIAIRDGGF